jgi:hypothetical protein
VSEHRWHAYKDRVGTWRVGGRFRLPEGGSVGVRLPRFILDAPRDRVVDHINGDGLDNTRDNLRLATQAQNSRNRKISKTSSSGYKGVFLGTSGRGWKARVQVDGVSKVVGRFASAADAARAYDSAARHYYGEFARLNFPDETPAPFAPAPRGYRGIFLKRPGKWCASLKFLKRRFYAGLYDSPAEAARAYDAKVREVGAPLEWLNNIQE